MLLVAPSLHLITARVVVGIYLCEQVIQGLCGSKLQGLCGSKYYRVFVGANYSIFLGVNIVGFTLWCDTNWCFIRYVCLKKYEYIRDCSSYKILEQKIYTKQQQKCNHEHAAEFRLLSILSLQTAVNLLNSIESHLKKSVCSPDTILNTWFCIIELFFTVILSLNLIFSFFRQLKNVHNEIADFKTTCFYELKNQ